MCIKTIIKGVRGMKIALTEENYELNCVSFNEKYITIELVNDYCTSSLELKLSATEALELAKTLSDKVSRMADLKLDSAINKLKEIDKWEY